MKYRNLLLLCALGLFFNFNTAFSQFLSRDEMIFLTSEWKGERFEDGRPKISDDLIERAKDIAIEEAWMIMENEGYHCQFEGQWDILHEDEVVAGRALTAMFMPSRPDVEKNIKERGNKNGYMGNTNSWPIDQLSKGDVYVADGFGKIKDGTLIGDNLGNSIYAKSGNGVIFYGSSRDKEGLSKIDGFNAFVKGWDPTFLKNVVLMGLNTPVRIGSSIVLPGDLVLAKSEGVIFIPAHLVEKVVTTSEFIALRDQFGITMLKSGKYSPGQIDNDWTQAIKDDFMKWLDKTYEEPPMSREQLEKFMEKRTW